MTGRWSCVVLLLALAACRTPQKKISVYSLDPDEFGTGRHLPAGSDVGETLAGRMNLPNYADTETGASLPGAITLGTSRNAPMTEVDSPKAGQPRPPSPAVGELPVVPLPSTGGPSAGGETGSQQPVRVGLDSDSKVLPVTATQPQLKIGSQLPEKSPAQIEPLHLPTGGWVLPTGLTNAVARVALRGDHNPGSGAPASSPIHLSLSSWTNSVNRKSAEVIDVNTARSMPAFVPRQFPASVNISAGGTGRLAGGRGPERSVAVPEVGRGATGVVEAVSQPVDLEPLLAGAHDADWRQRQVARQRAEETARQSERDRLAKSLQQLLQPSPK